MEFGVFDHLDGYGSGGSLADYYEDRLRIAQAYDRAGFYGYHVAEHHSTRLGMAPSPSVFLAAVAQRTQRLRFGPLVWPMPLYHPLRLIEEICMLDHLSRGRLELGFGRGAAHLKDELMPKYAELIYNGFWFSPEREMLQAAIDRSQQFVTGTVKLKLYKGSAAVVARSSPYSLYEQELVTFEEGKVAYDQRDAEGFIRLNALRLRTLAQRRKKLKLDR